MDNMDLDNFIKKVENTFSIPFEKYGISPESLIPIGRSDLYGSKSAAKDSLLTQGGIMAAKEKTYKDYRLIGFWGHGTNSYAFYYVKFNENCNIFFRLSYGGIYSDINEQKENITRFLNEFFEFEANNKSNIKKAIYIESMGFGYYKIETKDGRDYKSEKSLLRSHDAFDTEFGDISNANDNNNVVYIENTVKEADPNTGSIMNKSKTGSTVGELQQAIRNIMSTSPGIKEKMPEKKKHNPKVTIIPTTPEQRAILDKQEKEEQEKKKKEEQENPIGLKQRLLNQYRKKGYSEEDFILLPQIVREDKSRGKGLIQRHEVKRSET